MEPNQSVGCPRWWAKEVEPDRKTCTIAHWAWMIQSTSCCAMNIVRTENSYLDDGVKSSSSVRFKQNVGGQESEFSYTITQ